MQIYIAEGTQQTGPFDLDTIKTGLNTGKFQPTQLAWYEGAPGWEPISKLPGMEAAAPPLPVAPPPPPAYSPAPPAPSYSPAPSPSPGGYSPPPYSPNPSAPPAPYSSAPPTPYSSAPPAPYSSAPPTPYSSAPPAPYSSAPPTPTGSYSPPPPSFVPPGSYPPGGTPPSKGFWAKIGGLAVTGLFVLFLIVKAISLFSRSSRLIDDVSHMKMTPTPSYASSSTPTPTPSYVSSSTPTPAPTSVTTPTPSATSSMMGSFERMHYRNLTTYFTSGDRQKYYVDFHFDYPNFFAMKSGTYVKFASDFVELTRPSGTNSTETMYFEGFHSKGNYPAASVLPTFGPSYTTEIEQIYRKEFPSLRMVSKGMIKVREFYDAYDYQAQATETYDGKPGTFVLRYILVAPRTGTNGVIVEMSAHTSVTEARNPGDLGSAGHTGEVLGTFAFD